MVFNIDISLAEFITYHNITINAVTKRKHNEIKDIDDLDIIEEVNNKIIKTMHRKLKFKANIKLKMIIDYYSTSRKKYPIRKVTPLKKF